MNGNIEEATTMVAVPKDIAIRMLKFLDLSAGDGIWFKGDETFKDELDAAVILMDLWIKYNDIWPEWVPAQLRDNW